GLVWDRADTEVSASVSERRWVRQAAVERLVSERAVDWYDALEPAASVPGSGQLVPGTGHIDRCDALDCWPRPPDGGTTARVTGLRWSRTLSTRVMSTRSDAGWRESVPSSEGSHPSHGEG